MTSVLNEIVEILVGGLNTMATGIASGLNTMATDLFITTTEGTKHLSAFGGIVAIFCAVSLGVGLTTLVTRFVMHFGK